MKILVLSFYYPPDLCAGSFRTAALIESLRAAVPAGSEIDVITTAPNRYHSFRAEAPEVEHDAGLSIFRIPLPEHQSGMIDQGRSFVWYARGVLRRVARRDYDIVYASSSRLMTAVLGAFVSARRGTRLYLDIRDIFVDNIRYVLPNRVSWFARPVFAALERWAVTRADVVNLVSRGFADYFDPRYPGQRFTYHTNGIDTAFLKAVPRKAVSTPRARPSLLTVLYAGNVGEGQGLHAILPPLAKAMEGRVRFEVVGGGGPDPRARSSIGRAWGDQRGIDAPR